MKDFFTAYRNANIRKYTTSGILALTLSVGVVASLNQVNPSSFLLSNVLEAGSQEKVDYSADLMVERQGNQIDLRLGKDAYDVDTLSLSLLGDPEKFLGITSSDPDVTVTSSESGVYMVKLSKNKAQIKAGEVITSLSATISGEAIITPVDVLLTSAGQSYTLSVKGE